MMRAIWNGTIIAESDDTIEADGHIYFFPPQSIAQKLFAKSKTTHVHPWLGKMVYYDVTVTGRTNHEAAWYYPDPPESMTPIKNYVTFSKTIILEGGKPNKKLERSRF